MLRPPAASVVMLRSKTGGLLLSWGTFGGYFVQALLCNLPSNMASAAIETNGHTNGASSDRREVINQAKQKLKDDGWCVIPDVLSPQETAHILERLWAAAEESERREKGSTHKARLDPNESNVRVFSLMDIDPIFIELISHPTAVEVVESLHGKNFLVSNFTANIARPGSGSMGLHSDLSLQCPDPWHHPWNLNIIWALTDVYYENGATLFIPGSHKWVNYSDVPADAEKMLVPFEAKAGSIGEKHDREEFEGLK